MSHDLRFKSRRVLGVIPARYGSTRLPGKPLIPILGQPLIAWVYKAAKRALRRVVVATDDSRIVKAVQRFGGEAVLTPRSSPTGTDRVAQVAKKIKADYYVNIQGDEPMLHPSVIRHTVSLAMKKRSVATAAIRLSKKERNDPHAVKVVLGSGSKALYFSRSLIPFRAKGGKLRDSSLKHLGLYVYPREELNKFVRLKASELEKIEKLEQLRALFNGIPIYVYVGRHDSIGVDTRDDLRKVERRLKLHKKYVSPKRKIR